MQASWELMAFGVRLQKMSRDHYERGAAAHSPTTPWLANVHTSRVCGSPHATVRT
jgi:hypothetical protein